MRIFRRVLALVVMLVLLLVIGWMMAGLAFHHKVITWIYGEPYADGKPMSYWAAQLKSNSHKDRFQALIWLEDFGEQAKPTIPLLTAFLERSQNARNGDDLIECSSAFKILGSFGESARSAVPALKQAR